jgi:hypothetical protein
MLWTLLFWGFIEMKNGTEIKAVLSETSWKFTPMDVVRKSSALAICTASLMFVACASPPPKPISHEQYLANRERALWEAVKSAERDGEDPAVVYSRLELLDCYHDAQLLADVAQRAPAVQQCRVTWPQPIQQPQQTVTTDCYSVNGNTRCTSR